jgi:acyl-CoA thioesterase
MSAFDEATALTPSENGSSVARADKRFWMQVGPFGGWTAGVALRAMTETARFDGVPVSLTVDYLGPIGEGEFTLRSTLVKQNKSSAFWRVEGGTGAEPALAATALFARRRETSNYLEITMPEVPSPASVPPLETFGLGPTWVRSFEMRHAFGMPMSGGASSRSLVWTRLKDDRPLDFFRVACYCDASIARQFYRTRAIAPVATVTMTSHFHCEPADLEQVGNGYILIDSIGQIAHRGYSDQVSKLWSEEGRLLATSEQMVWFNLADSTPAKT